jgi:hypothetical protein
MRRLEARHVGDAFDLQEIVADVMRHTPAYPEQTVRTQIASVMCANAPVHHANHTNDLERVGRGRYRRVTRESADMPRCPRSARGLRTSFRGPTLHRTVAVVDSRGVGHHSRPELAREHSRVEPGVG